MGAVAWGLWLNAPFPIPAHRHGHADFRHPACMGLSLSRVSRHFCLPLSFHSSCCNLETVSKGEPHWHSLFPDRDADRTPESGQAELGGAEDQREARAALPEAAGACSAVNQLPKSVVQ